MSEPKFDDPTVDKLDKVPPNGAANRTPTEKLPSRDNDTQEPYGFYRNWNSPTDMHPTRYPPPEDPWRAREIADSNTEILPVVEDRRTVQVPDIQRSPLLPKNRGGRGHRGAHTRQARRPGRT